MVHSLLLPPSLPHSFHVCISKGHKEHFFHLLGIPLVLWKGHIPKHNRCNVNKLVWLMCLCAKSLTFVKVTGRRVAWRPQKAEKDDKNESMGKAVRNHSRYVKWWSVITSHLSPNAVVPQRAGPRVATLWLGGFHPLITVAVAATVRVLADHHSPLETSRTGTGTLQSVHSANSKT